MDIIIKVHFEEDYKIFDPTVGEDGDYVNASECADYKDTIKQDIAEILDTDASQVSVEIK